jgi:glycosyltransferase involved in cell wall biosynthesis
VTPIRTYAPVGHGSWDWRSPETTGIGGSETCVIETARRLGNGIDWDYSGIVYAPVPEASHDPLCGWAWEPAERADFALPGLWIVHRCPAAGERLQGQRAFHVSHDLEGDDAWTPERAAGFERILVLCAAQRADYERRFPFLSDRLSVWSNGIPAAKFAAWDREAPKRHPKRLIWSSSPDRGLFHMLAIFRRAFEYDEELRLEVAYGLDTLPAAWKAYRERLERLLDHPGVTCHGRLPQSRLHDLMRSSGLWVYPTTWSESSCITAMEAQALGCVPITRPYFALAENVLHGLFIDGDPADYLVRARYVEALLDLANDPERQERIRAPMIYDARARFDWDVQVRRLEGFIEEREALAA